MDIEGIVIFDAAAGVPLFSRMKTKTDPSLFSSFIAAIGHFSKELQFGGLSSFTTEEKVIYLAPRDKIITALIAPKKKEYDQAYALANELGRQFEESTLGLEVVSSTAYSEFMDVADQYLRKIRNPFISRVSEFILEEYDGKVSIQPSLMKRDGTQGKVDLLIDAGRKDSDQRDSWGQFGENYSFVKVLDTRAGRVQVIDFIDSLGDFGVLSMKKDELVLQPYFPARAIIVAREYDTAAIDFLKKLPDNGSGRYVDGAYIFVDLKLKGLPKETRCVVDVWQWQEDLKPLRIEL
ncbi:MAG: hypothetical protein KGD60_05760 [Candidatus Thorarchaeota archaeon]|nr:hypothetical protein [Candidatus Thorarchaeota archaeon]